MIGSRLGNYEILEEIGAGGMGRVYRARQQALERMVAVKVLLPQFANDRQFVERFLREARAIAALEHPGIVTVYDVGESAGTYFFAMQFLAGRTLDRVLADEGPLPPEQAIATTRHVAEALGHAHAAGILHRDVKPGNIFLTDDGRVVLTDFGIAWAASQTRLTMANSSLGSPGYMAPEQVEGRPLDQRADLYSLGIVLYEMLTGDVPFQGDSAVSVAYQHVQAPVPSARERNPAVPAGVDAITQRLMSKSPDDRYFAAGDLIQDLDTVGSGAVAVATTPGRSRRSLVLGVGIAATALVLAILGILLTRNDWETRVAAGSRDAPGAQVADGLRPGSVGVAGESSSESDPAADTSKDVADGFFVEPQESAARESEEAPVHADAPGEAAADSGASVETTSAVELGVTANRDLKNRQDRELATAENTNVARSDEDDPKTTLTVPQDAESLPSSETPSAPEPRAPAPAESEGKAAPPMDDEVVLFDSGPTHEERALAEVLDWSDQGIADKAKAKTRYARALRLERDNPAKSDSAAALDLFEKSAKRGYAKAQFRLGRVYENGLGVEANVEVALGWYRLAAVQGNHKAELALARLARIEGN